MVDLEEVGSDQNLLERFPQHRPPWRLMRVRVIVGVISVGLAIGVLMSVRGAGVQRTRISSREKILGEFELQDAEQQAVDVSTGVVHTWQHYWNKLEGNKRVKEALAKENEMQKHIETNVRAGVGDIKNQTAEFDKHRMKQRMKHSMQHLQESAADFEKRTHKYKKDLKSLMKTKVFLNGSTSRECPDLDGLYIEKVLHSNLGGKGPDKDEASLILLGNRSEAGATVRQLAFKVTASTPYTPGWTQMNGMSQGLVGKYGQITIKPGTSVRLKIQTFDLETRELVHMPSAAFTFFDLDMAPGGEQREFLTVGGFDRVETTPTTEVRRQENLDNTTTFEASTVGSFDDNPVDPLLLTQQQKNRAVTVIFSNVNEVEVILGAGHAKDPGAWRCFEFVLHPVLKCAHTLETKKQDDDQGIPLPYVLCAGLLGILIVLCFFWWCCC